MTPNASDTPNGVIRIACSQFIAQDVLSCRMQTFLEHYEGVRLEVHVSNQHTNLVGERIDLAIRITNDLDPNVIARPLGRCHSILCASPDYIKTNGSPSNLTDLSHHNCLIYSGFEKQLWHFVHTGESKSIAVSGNFSANESMLLLNAVLQDRGISLQPRFAVTSYLDNSKFVEVLPDYNPLSFGVYAIYRSRKHQSLALRYFIDALVNYCNSIDL